MSQHHEQDSAHDEDDRLADHFGMTAVTFWGTAGRNWWRIEVQEDHPGVTDWYGSGEPVQVLLGLPAEGLGAVVAQPRGHWRLGLVYSPASPVLVHGSEDLPAALAAACTARRRTFRWCRLCRRATAPEHLHGKDVCMACAEVVLGVVH